MECPICFENIGDKNCLVTDCGHSFHTSCLMQNVSVNGFGCPCCREIMKQKDAYGGEEYEENEENEEDEEYEENEEYEESQEDYSLRGMRMFHRIINGDIPYQEDLEDESDEWGAQPSIEKIAELLTGKGITLEHFIKAMIGSLDETEYEINRDETEEIRINLIQKTWDVIRVYSALPEFHDMPLESYYDL